MTMVDAPTRPNASLTAADVAAAAQLACLLEASAPKPGNVSPGRHFSDARYEDFLASAVAIGEPLAGAGTRPLGATIRLASEATARWTRSNTNLGIVLLLSPLARAALLALPEAVAGFGGGRPSGLPGAHSSGATALPPDERASRQGNDGLGLRGALRDVLAQTTIDDALEVYAAIRLAAPGGLGRAENQDVNNQPTITLFEVMRLAAERDGIAREYATGFEATFETGVPALERARRDALSWDDAIVETFLTLLAASPDTHIIRRAGITVATDVSQRAQRVLDLGGVRSTAGRRAIDDMDTALRDAHNTANPGTTADLTAAAIFVLLLGGGWPQGGRHAAAG